MASGSSVSASSHSTALKREAGEPIVQQSPVAKSPGWSVHGMLKSVIPIILMTNIRHCPCSSSSAKCFRSLTC